MIRLVTEAIALLGGGLLASFGWPNEYLKQIIKTNTLLWVIMVFKIFRVIRVMKVIRVIGLLGFIRAITASGF